MDFNRNSFHSKLINRLQLDTIVSRKRNHFCFHTFEWTNNCFYTSVSVFFSTPRFVHDDIISNELTADLYTYPMIVNYSQNTALLYVHGYDIVCDNVVILTQKHSNRLLICTRCLLRHESRKRFG